jgi:hypothetical protein
MTDFDFEAQADIDCRVESFEDSREWQNFTYAENEAFLNDLIDLDIYRYIHIEMCLNWSKDAYLVNNGYFKHPLKIKRSKYQKLKKSY